ncbi:glycosyltransferase family 2 protein [Pseudoflavonifractor sp. P01025]|uniref:glycosyltransferase family 2 protein n=1 Tax=Flintibacter porci TaxID=3342383 RepID=UPI0035B5BAB1
MNKKDCPFFSVIIPVYQCERTINACVESVLTQGEESLEIVLVDDGATDQSSAICDSYHDRFPALVTVLHKRNEGPLAARLDGIQASTGQYVMFLDSDDRYLPGIFRRLRTVIQTTQADMVLFNHTRVLSDGTKNNNRPAYGNRQMFEGTALSRLLEDAVTGSSLNALWQKCARRELLQGAETFRQYGRLIIGEDKLLSLQIIGNSNKAVYIADALYEYHISRDSLSHSLGLRHYQDMATVLSEIRALSCKLGVNNYNYLYSKNKVEFGISCLYSTARRVLMKSDTVRDFESLAKQIKGDHAFWSAYDLCCSQIAIHKRIACLLLRHGWTNVLFLFFKCSIQTK